MLSRIQKYFSLSGTLTVLLLCYNMNTGKAQVYAEEGFMGGDTLAISGFTDGPHVEWKDLKNFEAMNFLYTDSLDLVSMSITAGRLKKGSRYLAGPNITPRKYRIDKDIQAGPQIIKTDQQIFVVGDVHGEYTKLIKLLRISGIINSSNNWSWGKGQLVFLGDLMDRGAQVTETLWFVKKIQYQAAKEGGGVHVILGNHEIMNLTGDHRYINRKYRLLSEKLGVDYFNFYEKNMELGRWIRSFNSIIR